MVRSRIVTNYVWNSPIKSGNAQIESDLDMHRDVETLPIVQSSCVYSCVFSVLITVTKSNKLIFDIFNMVLIDI